MNEAERCLDIIEKSGLVSVLALAPLWAKASANSSLSTAEILNTLIEEGHLNPTQAGKLHKELSATVFDRFESKFRRDRFEPKVRRLTTGDTTKVVPAPAPVICEFCNQRTDVTMIRYAGFEEVHEATRQGFVPPQSDGENWHGQLSKRLTVNRWSICKDCHAAFKAFTDKVKRQEKSDQPLPVTSEQASALEQPSVTEPAITSIEDCIPYFLRLAAGKKHTEPWRDWWRRHGDILARVLSRGRFLHLQFFPYEVIPRLLKARGKRFRESTLCHQLTNYEARLGRDPDPTPYKPKHDWCDPEMSLEARQYLVTASRTNSLDEEDELLLKVYSALTESERTKLAYRLFDRLDPRGFDMMSGMFGTKLSFQKSVKMLIVAANASPFFATGMLVRLLAQFPNEPISTLGSFCDVVIREMDALAGFWKELSEFRAVYRGEKKKFVPHNEGEWESYLKACEQFDDERYHWLMNTNADIGSLARPSWPTRPSGEFVFDGYEIVEFSECDRIRREARSRLVALERSRRH